MRHWRKEQPQSKPATRRNYETVGYVIDGKAELTLEGQMIPSCRKPDRSGPFRHRATPWR
jgi:hypothetical protein